MTNKYYPRNNTVVLRQHKAGLTKGGLARPDISADSKRYTVEAFGISVDGLSVGDEVIMRSHVPTAAGLLSVTALELADDPDLLLIDGDHIICVVQRNVPEDLAN